MMLVFLLACPSTFPKVPPVTAPVSSSVVVSACCTLGDGPVLVRKGTIQNGAFVDGGEIGRMWAFDDTADLDGDANTRDWYEYAEKKSGSGVWSWMTATQAWKLTVPALTPSQLPHKCNDSGYLKCQEFEVATANANPPGVGDPKTESLTARVDPGKRERLTQYHAEGTYKVTATWDSGATMTAWYHTKAATGGRQEVWCEPSGWSWPRRDPSGPDVAVSWVLNRTGNAPATLPTDPTSCGNLPDGTATAAVQSNSVKL